MPGFSKAKGILYLLKQKVSESNFADALKKQERSYKREEKIGSDKHEEWAKLAID